MRILLALTPLWGILGFSAIPCVANPDLIEFLATCAIAVASMAAGFGVYLFLRRRTDHVAWGAGRVHGFGAIAVVLAYSGAFTFGLAVALQVTLCVR